MSNRKTISPISSAKFLAVLGVLIGFLCGLFYSVGGFLIDVLVSMEFLSSGTYGTPGLSYGTLLAFGALIGMPLLLGAAGFLLGLVAGLLFNGYLKGINGLQGFFDKK
jgi:hypothetical protein